MWDDRASDFAWPSGVQIVVFPTIMFETCPDGMAPPCLPMASPLRPDVVDLMHASAFGVYL